MPTKWQLILNFFFSFFFSPTGWELLITTFLTAEHAYHTTPMQLHTYIHKMHTDDENKNSSQSADKNEHCEKVKK
jgi:hypothetical protein